MNLPRRQVELEKALREARAMLCACGLDEPDDEYQASWERGLARIDAVINGVESAWRTVTYDAEWYANGVRFLPGEYVVCRLGPDLARTKLGRDWRGRA